MPPAALAEPDGPRIGKPPSTATTLAVCAGVVAALYFGRVVLVPVALAILLSFVLAPGVAWLRRWRLGRVTSVLVMVTFAFVVIFGVGTVIGTQVTSLAGNLPRYERTIRDKIRAVKETDFAGGVVERVNRTLENLGREIEEPEPPAPSGEVSGSDAAEPEPIPVEIQQPPPKQFEVIQSIVGPLLEPLATAGIVIVFVIFILLQREDLRDRFIRLTGAHDLQRTTVGITDAARRVSRYLLMQTIVNATYGVPIGLGLWAIGVPNPILWGILAAVLRFVPYVGPIIAAIFPLALSIAVDPGWTMFAWTAALFLAVELISNNAVEPWLYGTSTGLSSIAIILAATFWAWLWGPIGLLLSTPLTSCLVVLGRHVPQLKFLDVMLGNQPVLAPEESFYQRMLASDPSEAAKQAEEYLKERPLSAYYDDVVIPALTLAQDDLKRGALDAAQRSRIRASIEEVLDDLSDYADAVPDSAKSLAARVLPKRKSPGHEPAEARPEQLPISACFEPADLPAAWRGKPILCVASRTDLDEAAARLMADLLEKHGLGARVIPWEATTAGNLSLLDAAGVEMLCISCLDPRLSTHVRYLIRRLRRKFPDTLIVVGFWASTDGPAVEDLVAGTGADLIAPSLRQALELICAKVLQASEGSHARVVSPPEFEVRHGRP